ncbi:MAG: hypothetical protein ACRD6W_15785, partial [Nitrososphaerales archaeon]
FLNVPLDFTPNHAYWQGEIQNNPGDHVVGSPADYVDVSGVQHLYNGAWYNDDPQTNPWQDQPTYGAFWGFSNSFNIWDTRG